MTNERHTLRIRGQEYGPYPLQEVLSMVDDQQVGLLDEIRDGDDWITIEEFLSKWEKQKRLEEEQLQREEQERQRQGEERRMAREEEQRRRDEEAKAEQRKQKLELELERERTRQKELVSLSKTSHHPPEHAAKANTNGTIIAGYICMSLALFLIPPLFGLAGLILGIINCSRDSQDVVHGVVQIIGSICCTILGFILAAAIIQSL